MQRNNINSAGSSNNVYYPNYNRPIQSMQRMPPMNSTNPDLTRQQMQNVNMNQNRMMQNNSIPSMNRTHPQNTLHASYNNLNMQSPMNNPYNNPSQNQYSLRQSQPTLLDQNSQSSFESEFPALGNNTSSSSNSRNNEKQREYTLNQEEFPALGGNTTRNDNNNNNSQDSSYSQRNQQQSRGSYTSTSSQNPTNDNKYGLLGLLSLIHNPEPENLALGIDLTTLGLNLNTPNPLYSTFGSPFADTRTIGVDKASMKSYKQPQMQPVHEKISLFEDSTLFFMFYGIPQDSMQIIASECLFQRGWRFHKKDRHWYRPAAPLDNSSKGFTNNSFHCFEPTTWKTIVKTNFLFHPQDFEIPPPSLIN